MVKGSIVALVTPMDVRGQIDWLALEKLVNWHVESGTAAIVSVGTTGESATLDFSEHSEVVKKTVEFAAGRISIIAGTGANSTQEALELTLSAKRDGADACLLVTPYYNKPTQEGLYQHHKLIAESVDIPQVLYNVPGRTACDLLPETIIRLAGVENIVGVKEATGNLQRITEIKSGVTDDFLIYSGDDMTALEAIKAGAVGDISVTANVAPEKMARMCSAALHGDFDEAQRLNAELEPLHDKLFVESNPIPVKWAMQQLGRIEQGIRLPLTWLTETYHEEVRQALVSAGALTQ